MELGRHCRLTHVLEHLLGGLQPVLLPSMHGSLQTLHSPAYIQEPQGLKFRLALPEGRPHIAQFLMTTLEAIVSASTHSNFSMSSAHV